MFRRLSLVLLQDKDGKVLMQHRTKDAPTNPDMWGLFGGHIKQGEKPMFTAHRELQEELGIEKVNLIFFKRYDFNNINREVFIYISKTNLNLKQLKKQQTEGQNVGFFSYDELKNMKVVEYVMNILNDFFT